ncbi:MAG: DsrE family protein [Nitrospirae bacterium]|nr:DsrE family protein [Nitrospirota bacterium]
MRLGILITTNRHLAYVLGLTNAAISKGHEVNIFNMDEGVKLLGEPSFRQLCGTKGVTMAYCDHSTEMLHVPDVKEGLPKDIICGSQFNNATMFHEADRVINL